MKESQSFLGLVNYFNDLLRDHSAMDKPFYDMVTTTTKNKLELLKWTNEGQVAFERLKSLVNVFPTLYFIDYSLRIILCTDASDYAHAYLCQLRPLPKTTEEPIRFLWACSIVLRHVGQPLRRRHTPLMIWLAVHFTIRTDHRNLFFMNNHGSRKVL